ncbi:MAG: transglycosylase SLT domain-containing protein [Sulfurovum sp.]|nr:transglycosylase SLT domain-containing protein [Sulfurovum sp.]
MIQRIFLLVLFILLPLAISPVMAKHFTFKQIHSMPKSTEKDYYIWRFLQQRGTTAYEAKAIIKEVNFLNRKLKTAYRTKTGSFSGLYQAFAHRSNNVQKQKNRTQGSLNFKKGISMVQKHRLKLAAQYFTAAYYAYKKRQEKDKALFWLYLVTKKNHYLTKLIQSCHINIYTFLAADIRKKKYPKAIIVPKVSKRRIQGVDIKDPIIWAKIKQKLFLGNVDINKLAEDYKSEETIGIHTYIKAHVHNFTKSYFPMPYRNLMRQYPIERQALIYAIARQESRFIPASVSHSFALGLMQFMPFLIDHIARQKGEKLDYDDIFDPYKAIEYANIHLDYLTKYLYHPLFIAYAYNGGIGFTKHLIRQKRNFRPGSFEPYLSMEKVKNTETGEYGKHVLTNYIVYMNLLGKPIRLLPFIETLTDPSMTDCFRK